MELRNVLSLNGFRNVLIFFLGLNLAWMETAVNSILQGRSETPLGWPPFNFYMEAVEWFWIHFALTGLTMAVIIYVYHVQLEDE